MPRANNKNHRTKPPIRRRVMAPAATPPITESPAVAAGLTQPVLLAELPEPHFARALLWSMSLLCLALMGWAAVSPLDEVARATGTLIARGNNVAVQHLDGGLVRYLHVREGQVVTAGQALLELDDGTTRQDLATTRSRITYLHDQHALLNAVLASTSTVVSGSVPMPELAALLARRATLATSLASTRAEWQRQQQLQAQGLGTGGRVYAALRDHQQAAQQMAALDADLHDQRQRTVTELAQQQEQARKLNARLQRLALRAPADGTVQNLRVNAAGTVVPPGGVVMEIVPADAPVVALLRIPPADIAMVRPGQRVALKVSAYDYSRYGNLTGRLAQLSADTIEAGGTAVYQGWVSLPLAAGQRAAFSKQAHGARYPLKPGMTVQADIVTGRRTVLAYLLRPLETTLHSAWREH